MKNGVPFDLAFSLSDKEALGFYVAQGEMESGTQFDWNLMQWPSASPPVPRRR